MWNPINIYKWNQYVKWENSPLKSFVELISLTLEDLPPISASICDVDYGFHFSFWGITPRKKLFCKAYRLQ